MRRRRPVGKQPDDNDDENNDDENNDDENKDNEPSPTRQPLLEVTPQARHPQLIDFKGGGIVARQHNS
jgi:hypothetical protein